MSFAVRRRRWRRSLGPAALLVWVASVVLLLLGASFLPRTTNHNGSRAMEAFSAAQEILSEDGGAIDVPGRGPSIDTIKDGASGGDNTKDEESNKEEEQYDRAAPSSPPAASSSSSSSLLVLCTADGSLYAIDAWTGRLASTIHTDALLQRSSHRLPPQTESDDDADEGDADGTNASDDGTVLPDPELDGSPSDTGPGDNHRGNHNDDDDSDPDEDLSYPSGSILPGLDGNLYYWLESAGAGGGGGEDEDDPTAGGAADGGQGGELTQLPLTMEGLLERPVQTCGSDVDDEYAYDLDDDAAAAGAAAPADRECGILTATLDTSLLAINERGEMLWRSAPGRSPPPPPPPPPSSRNDPPTMTESQFTLVLQRKDYHVRQVSTATGQQVWNATLGTWHALDFSGDDDEEYDEDDADDNELRLLTAGVQDKRETLEEERLLPLAARSRGAAASSPTMPSIVFSTGKEIVAVHPTTRAVLWKLEADSVVATVFAIHKGRWKPLNVLQEEDLLLEGRGSLHEENPKTLLLLDSRSSESSRAKQDYRNLYDAPLMHWFEHYRSKQRLVPSIDAQKALPAPSDVEEVRIDANGQQVRSNIRYCSPGRLDCQNWQPTQLRLPAPNSVSMQTDNSDSMKGATPFTMGMVQPDGLLVSWRAVTITLALIVYAVVLGRIWYLHKKQSWLDATSADVQQGISMESAAPSPPFAHSRSLEATHFDSRSSTSDATALRRSMSLPDTYQQLLRTEPSPVLNKSVHGLPPLHESSPSGAPTSPVSITKGLTTIPSASPVLTAEEDAVLGGTGAGIPLVRYSRYASEYKEVGPLGKGGFGSVYQCQNVLDGREYAIKKVGIRSHRGDGDSGFEQRLERTLREVKILAVLDHPNIVRYFGAWLEIEKEERAEELDGDNSFIGLSRCYSSSMITESASHRPLNRNRNFHGAKPGEETSEDSGTYGYAPPPRQPYFSRRVPFDDCGFIFEESEEEGNPEKESGPNQSNHKMTTSGDGALPQSAHPLHTTEARLYTPNWTSDRDATAPAISARPETGLPHETQQSPPRIVRHTLYIQMQLCSHRTVADFLLDSASRQGSVSSDDASIDIPLALRLFLQIAHAVRYVHEQGLIHRDLKPQNCFMDDSGSVKVGDFGLSRESADARDESVLTESISSASLITPLAVGDDHTAGVGTRAYASPEQMNGSAYDASTDVYSLGIILFELVYPMYTGMERNICLSRLRHASPALPKDWERFVGKTFPSLRDLILSMVCYDSSKRPTAAAVAQHIQGILSEFTIISLDETALLRQDIILLRVEAKHSPNALTQTIQAIEESARDSEQQVQVVQYGLRSSNAVAIMEFALEYSGSGPQLVSSLCERPSVLKVRQVSTAPPAGAAPQPQQVQPNTQYLNSS